MPSLPFSGAQPTHGHTVKRDDSMDFSKMSKVKPNKVVSVPHRMLIDCFIFVNEYLDVQLLGVSLSTDQVTDMWDEVLTQEPAALLRSHAQALQEPEPVVVNVCYLF